MVFYIYEIRNNLNGKNYIGQRKCPENKTPETDRYMGSGLKLNLAFKKYDKKNFTKIILAITGKKEVIDVLEKVYIKLFRESGKAEYNIADGGQGGDLFKGHTHSEEYKKFMKEINQGNNNPFYKKHHTPEALEKMRNYRLGKKLSKSTLEKMSKSLKGHAGFKGHTHSEESRNKMRVSLKLKMTKVKESYQKYKLKNNKITWNEFQKLYKNGEV